MHTKQSVVDNVRVESELGGFSGTSCGDNFIISLWFIITKFTASRPSVIINVTLVGDGPHDLGAWSGYADNNLQTSSLRQADGLWSNEEGKEAHSDAVTVDRRQVLSNVSPLRRCHNSVNIWTRIERHNGFDYAVDKRVSRDIRTDGGGR
ncbi:hypothetical protein TNIN_30401 [Trichonephila inaurata madagascariensis]|uniref:Uncharacterized protein n=1 Tax=Trichonephila inaurata madagascariensis TaxID=2747483 RepID=A0A8X6YFH2_9ARAC|nr:hypothetical protein TNIN_30401 [Trichonephila inaurata madagascariensis]